jgi:DNA-binding beta-propeller fold protein YncE
VVATADEGLLYVDCADSNTVTVTETQTGRQIEVIATSLYPRAHHGSTPNSLTLAANGKTLWVANADANNLAVIDVSRRGQSRSLGFIPVGWYPLFHPRYAYSEPIIPSEILALASSAI